MEWKLIVTRNLSALFLDFITQGQTKKALKELFNLNCGFDYRTVENGVWYTDHDIEKSHRVCSEEYAKRGSEFLQELIDKWSDFFNELGDIALEISKKDYSDAGDNELVAELEKFNKAFYKCSSALYLPLIVTERPAEEIIRGELKKRKVDNVEDYFNILTTSVKENESTKELKSILRMAIQVNNGEDISNEVKFHIKEFGWINTKGLYGEAWTEEEVYERIESMLKEDLKKRLTDLENHPKEVEKGSEKILSEINADVKLRDFVKMAKEYVYFRTYRMDNYTKSGFLARILFNEVAKRIGLNYGDIIYLTYDEIVESLKEDKDFSKEIEERKRGFAFILLGEKISVLSGSELEDYKKNEIKDDVDKNVKEIKGVMACRGLVRGFAKLVFIPQDLDKVKKGDILVAPMTTPNFITAMERASGFITDEGGILCHAAIISREMGKPCIIGTQVATRVLVDGDEVELDADSGVVRKLGL